MEKIAILLNIASYIVIVLIGITIFKYFSGSLKFKKRR